MINTNLKIVAKTLKGLEGVLADELSNLGAEDINPKVRAVEFSGDRELLYTANLKLRTALRVLVNIRDFRLRNQDDLYKTVIKIPWEDIIAPDSTIAIDNTVFSTIFSNSHFATLKTKDAIVDRLKQKRGTRPNIDTNKPDYLINIRISEDLCSISLDSSGRSLHLRGYRKSAAEAPISEVLAAGMILLSGWNGETPLYDPMCGSATIPIEAALIATNTAPNLYDLDFGFTRWENFDLPLFNKVVAKAKSEITELRTSIYASDISTKSFDSAASNIINSKTDELIKLSRKDFFQTKKPIDSGTIIMNPPYDERMELEESVEFYRQIGNKLKFDFSDWTAWVISSNLEAMKFIGLKPDKKIPLVNGALECRYNKYSLFKGKRNDNRDRV